MKYIILFWNIYYSLKNIWIWDTTSISVKLFYFYFIMTASFYCKHRIEIIETLKFCFMEASMLNIRQSSWSRLVNTLYSNYNVYEIHKP